MKNGWGGRRANQGRKPGQLTKKTQELVAQATRDGITPIEVMIKNMRHFHQMAESAEEILANGVADKIVGLEPKEQLKVLMAEVMKAANFRALAQGCARDAAPYIHPRLATVEHKGEVEVSTVVRVPPVQDKETWQKLHAPKTPMLQ